MKKGVCRVCVLIDNNYTKKKVEFCPACDHFICLECKPNLVRRGIAMLKEKLNG